MNGAPVLGIPDGPYLEQASQEALAVLDGLGATPVPLFADIRRSTRLPAPADLRDGASPRAGSRASPIATVRAQRPSTLVWPSPTKARRRSAPVAQPPRGSMKRWTLPGEPLVPVAAVPHPDWTRPGIPSLPWTHAGLPVVTLPWGTAANGLPLGLQLVARFMDDERLLTWAAQLERSTSVPA
jgi:hypothetical protein